MRLQYKEDLGLPPLFNFISKEDARIQSSSRATAILENINIISQSLQSMLL